MTAEPTAPGRGLWVYQPATAVVDGTCRLPLDCSPRWMSEVFTPIAGIVSETGSATCATADSPPGACAVWLGTGLNFGAATVDGLAGRGASWGGPRPQVTPAPPAPP